MYVWEPGHRRNTTHDAMLRKSPSCPVSHTCHGRTRPEHGRTESNIGQHWPRSVCVFGARRSKSRRRRLLMLAELGPKLVEPKNRLADPKQDMLCCVFPFALLVPDERLAPAKVGRHQRASMRDLPRQVSRERAARRTQRPTVDARPQRPHGLPAPGDARVTHRRERRAPDTDAERPPRPVLAQGQVLPPPQPGACGVLAGHHSPPPTSEPTIQDITTKHAAINSTQPSCIASPRRGDRPVSWDPCKPGGPAKRWPDPCRRDACFCCAHAPDGARGQPLSSPDACAARRVR